MEIRKPKFELGQKAVDKNGDVGTVIKFNSYHFEENEYWYDVSYDGEVLIKKESFLEPYAENPKSVWDLKEGDTYYSIYGNGYVSSERKWFDDDYENNYREIGNAFLTREEAEFEVERRKIETEMIRLGGRRVFKKGENNYYIVCDFDSHYGIWISNNKSDGFSQMMIYFDTLKETEDAIKTIGEDRIRKYIFGVEE